MRITWMLCQNYTQTRFRVYQTLLLQPWNTHVGALSRQGFHKQHSCWIEKKKTNPLLIWQSSSACFPRRHPDSVYFSVRMPSLRQTNVYRRLCVLKRHGRGAGGLYGSWKVTLEVKSCLKKRQTEKNINTSYEDAVVTCQ